MPDDDVLKQARNRALRYLTYRDRTEHEMRSYLAGKEFDAPTVDLVVDYLKRLGYVDDARFALQWGRYRIETKQFGRFRLKQDLRLKGLGDALIEETLRQLYGEHDEKELARDAAVRKLPKWKNLDKSKQRQRLAGFLQRKGFSSETVFDTVERLIPY
ncbi:regulatory protein RecX [Nitrospina watsonii]|uniref:Regulatory protein RecX n=1 Tax=Nitrospina watsonii TaxID=1323948 RepID=A0ABM9HC94_9BACT|nr:regulatory protein RecX [Nitrospina watsonii]CAI2717811.1 Regulatory protein RecX [Nitrospina watsonii]